MRFTTNAYPKEQRHDAWRFALKRISVVLHAADEASLYGELIQFRSGSGINFVRLTGTAQEYAIDFREEPGCFWLAVLLDGVAEARSGTEAIRLGDGEMICARGEAAVALQFASDHRILLLQIPAGVIDQGSTSSTR